MLKSNSNIFTPKFYSTSNKIDIMKFLHDGKVLINEDNLIFYLNKRRRHKKFEKIIKNNTI